VVRNTAKNPRNNIARTNRIFSTRTPPGEITANLGLRLPVVKDPKPMLNGEDGKYLEARRVSNPADPSE
jgi:hypothetical protein